jgi:hypothetical protein
MPQSVEVLFQLLLPQLRPPGLLPVLMQLCHGGVELRPTRWRPEESHNRNQRGSVNRQVATRRAGEDQ